jgi:acyl-CoA thioesterase FadM
MMAQGKGFLETYRGGVAAWECDAFGHLNIAFYVERFGDAALGLLARHAPGRSWRTVSLYTRYKKELRAGDPIVISSGIMAADDATLRLAHYASDGADISTRAEHVLALRAPDGDEWAGLRAELGQLAVARQDETYARLDPPPGTGPIAAVRDRVKAREADETGRLSLFGFVDRFSTSCLLTLNAIGMTGGYMRAASRGYATFETRLDLDPAPPAVGEGVEIRSGVVEVGNSSLKLLHEMRAASSGALLARFYQAGVHFDLAARRSAPLPQDLRERAAALRVGPQA